MNEGQKKTDKMVGFTLPVFGSNCCATVSLMSSLGNTGKHLIRFTRKTEVNPAMTLEEYREAAIFEDNGKSHHQVKISRNALVTLGALILSQPGMLEDIHEELLRRRNENGEKR